MIFKESVDPRLKTPAKSELGSEYLILAEDKKERARSNAQPSKSLSVPVNFSIHRVEFLLYVVQPGPGPF
jgi:hypothetical protein